MCGIVGIFSPGDSGGVSRRLLEQMTNRLTHRGPDDSGFHVEQGVGLGFRRLSIIDVAGGHQPIFNEDGTVAAIFNGEIYNFRELRAELVDGGHRFSTSADSEVLVHGWETWGEDLLPRLRGMFAFALWDRPRRLLFLARDRLGIKPLYYSQLPDGRWIFGSELKALLADPALPRQIDPRAVDDYFALGYIPDPHSILMGVSKLPPGHSLTLGSTPRPGPVSYWDLPMCEAPRTLDPREAEEELLARLDETVRAYMVSDVPLGAFLSGGIDSSAVVSSMARASEQPVRTCSIGFDEQEYDESSHTRRRSRDSLDRAPAAGAGRFRSPHSAEARARDGGSPPRRGGSPNPWAVRSTGFRDS